MEKYWMWLCSVPGLYCGQIQLLVTYFGTPREVYEASEKAFEPWRKKQIRWIDRLLSFRQKYPLSEVCHRVEQRGIKFISREAPDFPRRLLALPDGPAGLFYKGNLPGQEVPAVAVVGARRCSTYGWAMAREISGTLAEAGVQIISGLASGIDGYAQAEAVKRGGSSFGVLGCGADICYPRENLKLYEALQREGGILSEFPVGTEPLKHHFPMRNRIISGLADAVVVVEARERSGSLITADLALEQGRDVYAVPGRSNDLLSQGCNRLIAQGAGLIQSGKSLLEHLNLPEKKKEIPKKNQLALAPEEKRVYSNLDLLPKGLDEISEKSGLPLERLGGILLRLQLLGLAAEVTKNYYAKLK